MNDPTYGTVTWTTSTKLYLNESFFLKRNCHKYVLTDKIILSLDVCSIVLYSKLQFVSQRLFQFINESDTYCWYSTIDIRICPVSINSTVSICINIDQYIVHGTFFYNKFCTLLKGTLKYYILNQLFITVQYCRVPY